MKKKLNILYEDKNILIINKPAKVLTVATPKEKINTLYQEVSAYVKKTISQKQNIYCQSFRQRYLRNSRFRKK